MDVEMKKEGDIVERTFINGRWYTDFIPLPELLVNKRRQSVCYFDGIDKGINGKAYLVAIAEFGNPMAHSYIAEDDVDLFLNLADVSLSLSRIQVSARVFLLLLSSNPTTFSFCYRMKSWPKYWLKL